MVAATSPNMSARRKNRIPMARAVSKVSPFLFSFLAYNTGKEMNIENPIMIVSMNSSEKCVRKIVIHL